MAEEHGGLAEEDLKLTRKGSYNAVPMLSLLALFTLTPASLDVGAGYYSLSELAGRLRAEGLAVEVRPDCADEVYAVRLKGVTPQSAIAALRDTGRLDVTAVGKGWRISRSSGDRDEDRSLLARYLQASFAGFIDARTTAAKRVVALAGRPAEEIDLALTEPSEANILARVCVGYFEIPFAALTLPPRAAGAPGKVFSIQIAEDPEAFFPGGRRDTKVALAPTTLKEYVVGAKVKIAFDPITTFGTDLVVFDITGKYAGQVIAIEKRSLLLVPPGPPKPEAVLPTRYASALRERFRVTESVLANYQDSVALPNVPIHLGDALLRAAEASGKNLLAYASPLSDRCLSAADHRSLSNIIDVANHGNFDAEFDRLVVRERCGSEPGWIAHSDWPAFSAKSTTDILVLRSEADFLARMVDGPAALPTTFENARYAGKKIPLGQLAAFVAEQKLDAWNGSTFSSRFLDFTNPTSFFPFARALTESPAFARLISGAKMGTPLETPVDNLDRNAKNALLNGIARAGAKCDARIDVVDPLHVVRMVRDGRFTNMHLRVTRDAARLDFEIFFKVPARGDRAFWRAWVTSVDA